MSEKKDVHVHNGAMNLENMNFGGFVKTSVALSLLIERETDEDVKKAIALLEECVSETDGKAMWMLGLCHEYGIGMKPDFDKAKALYYQSSRRGDSFGEFLFHLNVLDNSGGSGYFCGSGLLHALAFNKQKHYISVVVNRYQSRYDAEYL